MARYTISETNLHICDSWAIRSREDMLLSLGTIKYAHKDSQVWTRSAKSLLREWRAHNLCYDLGILRSHTADVDLDVPTHWYTELAYAIASLFYIA